MYTCTVHVDIHNECMHNIPELVFVIQFWVHVNANIPFLDTVHVHVYTILATITVYSVHVQYIHVYILHVYTSWYTIVVQGNYYHCMWAVIVVYGIVY